jgi:hypothetical protein
MNGVCFEVSSSGCFKLNLHINQTVSHRPVNVKSWIPSRAISCGICDGQSGNEIGFSPSISVSPLCTIPPVLLLNISFIYCRSYIILATDCIIKQHSYRRKICILHIGNVGCNVNLCATQLMGFVK